MAPLAYFLTFSTYGTHLPGSEKGWVDAKHCIFGTPTLVSKPDREEFWRSRLLEPPCILDGEARLLTLDAILGACKHWGWVIFGVHVRTTHVHAVI